MAKKTKASQNEAVSNTSEPSKTDASITNEELAHRVIKGIHSAKVTAEELLELRDRFAKLKKNENILGYRRNQWEKFRKEKLGMSAQTVRRWIRETCKAIGKPTPGSKHDGSKKRIYRRGRLDVAEIETNNEPSTVSHRVPQWNVPTPDGHGNFPARSAFQKELRLCLADEEAFASLRGEIEAANADGVPDGVLQEHEQNACYWITQLYHAGCDVWKKLLSIAHEDVGIETPQVFAVIRQLEQDAKRIKDNSLHPDLLVVYNAVLILCRCKKSRVADHIAIMLDEKKTFPAWRPVSQADIKAAVKAAQVYRDVPDYAIDRHTTEGRAMGRGLDFFLENGQRLGNRADDNDVFSDDYRKGYLAGYAAALADATAVSRPDCNDAAKAAA